MSLLLEEVLQHYQRNWNAQGSPVPFFSGPIGELPGDFHIREFEPGKHPMWAYATCGLMQADAPQRIEVHIFAPRQNERIAELLYAISHFHCTGTHLDYGHSVNLGYPWWPDSACQHMLISRPYLDGPEFENGMMGGFSVRFLWLIPVTADELEFKKIRGLNALEKAFEKSEFDYLDPNRQSVVSRP
jgi:hypothetical protein